MEEGYWLGFWGLEKEEQKGGRLGAAAAASAGGGSAPAVREELLGEKEDMGVLQAVEEKVEENRRTGRGWRK